MEQLFNDVDFINLGIIVNDNYDNKRLHRLVSEHGVDDFLKAVSKVSQSKSKLFPSNIEKELCRSKSILNEKEKKIKYEITKFCIENDVLVKNQRDYNLMQCIYIEFNGNLDKCIPVIQDLKAKDEPIYTSKIAKALEIKKAS